VDDDEAQLAVLGQVVTWERRFLPALLRRCDQVPRAADRPPIAIAMTEWGPLGAHPARLMAENFGAVIYAATFLGMAIRNAERIPIASPNGFMHGGCVRKVAGRLFLDPQVVVQDRYRSFVGARPLGCTVTGPGYDIDHPADIGARDRDVPFVDAVVCRGATDGVVRAALANRHPTRAMTVELHVPGFAWPAGASVETLAYPDVAARATPAEPARFPVRSQWIGSHDGTLIVSLPPSSAAWVQPC
jgi:alpha-N-arabinofuranosidase